MNWSEAMRAMVAMTLMGASLALTGCPALFPDNTVVRLVNDTSGEVEVRLYYGDEQLTTKSLLELSGEELNFTIPSGGTRSFTRDCDDLQAIFIEQAELNLIGTIGPEAESDLYRDGDDFNCNDTLTFRFTDNLISLDIDFSASSN